MGEKLALCLLSDRLHTRTNPKTQFLDKLLKFQIELTGLLFKSGKFFGEFSIYAFFVEERRLDEDRGFTWDGSTVLSVEFGLGWGTVGSELRGVAWGEGGNGSLE